MDPYRSAAAAAPAAYSNYGRENTEDFLVELERSAGLLFGHSIDNAGRLSTAQLQAIIRRIDGVASLLKEARLVYENSLKEKGVSIAASSSSDVTVELIRETFYNMIPQAIESVSGHGLISDQQINDQEDFIYPGIAALALIAVIELSKNISDGIRLFNHQVILKSNCPDEFKPLLTRLLQIKEGIDRLSPDDSLLLKIACVNNPAKPFPAEHPRRREIMAIAAVINGVASQITQRDRFKALVTEVLAVSKAFIK